MTRQSALRLLLVGISMVFGLANGCGGSKSSSSGYAKPGEPGTPDLGEMMKLLKTGDDMGKRLACAGLARLGAAAKEAIPELEKLKSTSKNADVKKIAEETIAKIQSAP